jgi:transcriptional regulator NrdR family protein
MPRGRPVKCPYCGSKESSLKGFRKTQTLGLRRIRRCKVCKRRFTVKKKEAHPKND